MSERFLPENIHRVAVIGAGTMGIGIAHVAALCGAKVVLCDASLAVADAGRAQIERNLARGVELGKVTAEARDATLDRIRTADAIGEAVTDADLVVEAVPEALDLKKKIFSEVDRAAPASALLASNTSSLSIAAIAVAVADPGRLIGMHFFNPVHLMKLVEVVRHDKADPAAVACANALAIAWGKTPITVSDSPGFASSRLGLVLGLEAMRMLEQGVASAADIDTAMKLGYGHPMGPLELTDLVGLDVRLQIADHLATTIGGSFTAPEILRTKVAAGDLGKKTGHGFYVWGPDGKRQG